MGGGWGVGGGQGRGALVGKCPFTFMLHLPVWSTGATWAHRAAYCAGEERVGAATSACNASTSETKSSPVTPRRLE